MSVDELNDILLLVIGTLKNHNQVPSDQKDKRFGTLSTDTEVAESRKDGCSCLIISPRNLRCRSDGGYIERRILIRIDGYMESESHSYHWHSCRFARFLHFQPISESSNASDTS